VRRGAGFHADKAGLQIPEEFDNLDPAQLPSDDDLAFGVDAVNLKPVLGGIEAN
jgi:hypothetical protein